MANYGDINPLTGSLYTPTEIMRINSGLDPATGLAVGSTPSTSTTTQKTPATTGTPAADIPNYQDWLNQNYPGATTTPEQLEGAHQEYLDWLNSQGYTIGENAHTQPTPTAGAAPDTTLPTITPPIVTPAPPYEISPAQQALQDQLLQTITDWVAAGGYGLPPEIQAQMIQQQSDFLKAREAEAIRVMNNNMERRGITNSGFAFSNEQQIRSNTTVAIAGAISNVQIQSALMKMASFEKAMGAAAQFLGYLSEQSQLAYAPKFATWQAEQMAKMQAWQANFDLLKMELNQAYQTQNIVLQGQITSQLYEQQHQFDIELAQMEIEANQKIAMAQGIGGAVGTFLGWIFGS